MATKRVVEDFRLMFAYVGFILPDAPTMLTVFEWQGIDQYPHFPRMKQYVEDLSENHTGCTPVHVSFYSLWEDRWVQTMREHISSYRDWEDTVH